MSGPTVSPAISLVIFCFLVMVFFWVIGDGFFGSTYKLYSFHSVVDHQSISCEAVTFFAYLAFHLLSDNCDLELVIIQLFSTMIVMCNLCVVVENWRTDLNLTRIIWTHSFGNATKKNLIHARVICFDPSCSFFSHSFLSWATYLNLLVNYRQSW